MTAIPGAVVVGVDISPDSDRGLRWAISAALSHGAPLHVLCAVPDPPYYFPISTSMDQERRARVDALLADARATAERAGCSPVTTESVDGSAAAALLAAGERALMIVVGARGHDPVAGMLLGSVSGHLSRHAACPVVVVREQADARAQRVVVGVDGSPGAEKAIGFAFDAASRQGAVLVAVHAWHYAWPDLRMEPRSMEEIAEDIQAREEWLRQLLADWAQKYPDVTVAREAIPDRPVRVLVNASERASLVVVGARGRGGFADLQLGSVGRAVLHHARCPVAIVR